MWEWGSSQLQQKDNDVVFFQLYLLVLLSGVGFSGGGWRGQQARPLTSLLRTIWRSWNMGRHRKLELQVFRLSEPAVQAVPEEAEVQLLQPISQNNNFYDRKNI